ncbi:MAG: Peptidyl-tRNA hydrolase [Crocinitomicaceae bacterium]|nr:MAG: Peptidyl-tRNA hydrolase [Crocinitomicaceae bacterium]
MKFLIVGLGNIGAKYESTRHNIGFKVLDFIAEQSSAFFIEEKYGDISSFKYKGKNIYLLKPNTFMNLSGLAVRYWLTKLKIDVKNLLVVTDDLNLEVGNLRMKKNGSDGGHNGLKDIQQTLSSNQYPRLRIGVGNNFPKGKQIDYVLGEWTKEEDLVLNQKMKIINEMVLSFCFAGIENTMNSFNNK